MNSNVRISFATMLEDVPREVHVLLDDIRRRLRNTEDSSLLNSDPYGEGWMFKIRIASPEELKDLLSDTEYLDQIEE